MSFSFVLSLSLFFFVVLLPNISLLPLAVLLLLPLPAARIVFAHRLVFAVFFAAAALYSPSKLCILSGTSPSTFRNLSGSSFSLI